MMKRHFAKVVLISLCTVGLSACPTERFRHEKYVCNNHTYDIAEIIVNDTGVGDQATIIRYGSEVQVDILSSSTASIAMELGELDIKINRNSGKVTVTRSNRYGVLHCTKSLFTM